MFDHDCCYSDLELLAKYGLKPYSNYEELSLQVVLFYCFKNGYSLNFLAEREEHQVAYLSRLMDILPEDAANVLGICLRSPYRFYDLEIAKNIRTASQKARSIGTYEYVRTLVALIQSSEAFLANGCHDYDHAVFLAEILKAQSCESLDYNEEKYPFLRAILSDKISLNNQNGHILEEDILYRFLIGQLSDTSDICPPVSEEYADSSITGLFYNHEGSLSSIDEYMDTIGGGDYEDIFEDEEIDEVPQVEAASKTRMAILDASEFNQKFFNFLDRYEPYDCILVPYLTEWHVSSVKHGIIRKCLEERMLSKVITDEKSTYLVLEALDEQVVRFCRYGAKQILDYPFIPDVTYDEIAECGYSLNPYVYLNPLCKDGYELVRLSDLCEIDADASEDFMFDPKTYETLPQYHFSCWLQDIFQQAESPKYYLATTYEKIVYCDPHIHIAPDARMFINKYPGYYMCPDIRNWALRVKDDRVSLEYLLYELNHFDGLKDALAISPAIDVLLKRKIAILKDRNKQDKLIAEVLAESSGVNSSAVYRIAVVDLEDNLIDLSSWSLDAFKFGHVLGQSGVLESIEKGADFDAVIVDALVDSERDRYKGLGELIYRLKGKDIPVYVYTSVDEELLRIDLYEEQFRYIQNGHYFRKQDEGALERLVKSIREELDSEENIVAEVRGRYQLEFEAANWLDQKFAKMNLASTLTVALIQPNKSFTAIRGALNRLYQEIMREISNGSGLDCVEECGILPRLLRDGQYIYKNQILFDIEGAVMPLPLAVSLCYASQIANGAVHEEDVEKMDVRGYLNLVQSEHLANVMIRILMDFILWLKRVDFKFAGVCVSADSNKIYEAQCSGILEKDNFDEYFCDTPEEGRIHVNMKSVRKEHIRLGSKIIITKLKRELKHRDRYRWITYSWSYSER